MAEKAQVHLARCFSTFPLKAMPVVEWKPFRTTAGRASFRLNTIQLSFHILQDDAALESTLIHEYAHLLAHHRHGKRGMDHGFAWKKAMRDLGHQPKVTHSFDCARNVSRQVVRYRCQKCGEMLERTRRLPKNRQFVHISCGGPIVFVEVLAR